jgi:hypothetical protein
MVGLAALLEWLAAARTASGGRSSGEPTTGKKELGTFGYSIKDRTAAPFSVPTAYLHSSLRDRPMTKKNFGG